MSTRTHRHLGHRGWCREVGVLPAGAQGSRAAPHARTSAHLAHPLSAVQHPMFTSNPESCGSRTHGDTRPLINRVESTRRPKGPLELAKLNKESGTSQPIAAHRNPSRHIATHRGPSQPIAAHRHEPTAAHRNPPRHTATPPGAVIKSHTPHQFIKVTQHINSTSELRRYKYNLYLTPQSPPRLGRKFRQFPRRSRTGTTVFPCA